MKPRLETLADCMAWAALRPDRGLTILDRREDGDRLSWKEIAVRATSFAGGLQALGLGQGDRVALILPTGFEFFDAFFGVSLAGSVPVPIYPPVRLGRLEEYQERVVAQLRAVEAELVITEPRIRRLLGTVLEQACPRLGCRAVTEVETYPLDSRPARTEDIALVQFSSGTTVEPKPVALSHAALIAQARILNSFWPETEAAVPSGVSWLPLYHDMGLIGCVLPALERPGDLTLLPPELFVTRPAAWLRAISDYRASISPAPNFAYSLCLEKIRDDELAGVDLSSWSVALNGAESVAPQVLRDFTERFARWGFRPTALTPVYGLSEAALAVTFFDLDLHFRSERFDREPLTSKGYAVVSPRGRELVSLGKPLPEFAIRIAGDSDRSLPEDRVGEVQVKGPSLMDGYLSLPEATEAVFQEGWLRTGDLGFLHEGELFLTGRSKDVLILRGRNHAPEEVEHALAGIRGVRSGCAVAVSHLPEGRAGESLLVFVETAKDWRSGEEKNLVEDCSGAILAKSGLQADEVHLLEPGSIPRTSSGKLRRAETLRRHLAGELDAASRVSAVFLAGALTRSALGFARWKWMHRARTPRKK